nr:uncharacterized protein LOC111845760 [Paramormyrops kingsleyae]
MTPEGTKQHITSTFAANPSLVEDRSGDYLQRMLTSYEELGRKLHQCMPFPTVPLVNTPAVSVDTRTLPVSHQPPSDVNTVTEKFVSYKDLPYLHRREFKVQGGQIGDHTSDITYNSLSKQIEEGVRENFSNPEIVRGVLKIVKPGNFKDMLMNKEDMTVEELKVFLRSHLGDRNSTELLQELMCTKQSDSETPQQFLYRVIGLKQKVLFASKQADTDIKYSPETIQGVFLHTVYQGLGHKHSDLRRELKPILSDSTVSEEAILRQVTKITSDEGERQRRLGVATRPKQMVAHSAQLKSDTQKSHDLKQKFQDKDVLQQLTAKIDALTSLVDSMRQSVPPGKAEPTCKCQSYKPSLHKRERPYGCPTHCFVCGKEGHRARGCLGKSEDQGNRSGSLVRDKQ